ncbi:hypothetical protein [Streptomyces macrosporus]|uniref:Uncharacterized protein n=1 Tax=Streptomyces macrosporus TaxID=44032 RepID=A0ABN3JXE5_9ACTN
MIHRISTLISAFGVLAATLLLAGAVREYRAGASALWVGLGVVVLLGAAVALLRDVARGRRGARTRTVPPDPARRDTDGDDPWAPWRTP